MKVALLYILIIGLLFTGLLGILKIGEGMQAPDDVSGEWNIDEEFVHSVKVSCIPVLLPEENPKILIQQSGIHLTLVFNDPSLTKLKGRIENHKLNLVTTLNYYNHSTDCNDPINLILSANLKKYDNRAEMIGIWYSSNCKDCPRINFSAKRSNNNSVIE